MAKSKSSNKMTIRRVPAYATGSCVIKRQDILCLLAADKHVEQYHRLESFRMDFTLVLIYVCSMLNVYRRP